jgi:tripartite-type tricarboxylate transporter receptor subunit TctC
MKSSLRQTATPQHRSRPRGNNRPHPKTPSSGQHPRRRFLGLAAGAAALPAISRIARAQAYPTRPITLIVPFAPGGFTDVSARLMAQHMRASLGQTVVVENVSGATGSIGVGRVARAAPDGYTISLGTPSQYVTNGALYALPYDVRDLTPIALTTNQPYLIVARTTLPANDLQGLIAWLHQNPNKAFAGTPGVGGGSHLGGLFFQNATGTRFQFVPYRGGAPALQDLIAGQIDLMFVTIGDCIELVRAGVIRAFAVAAKTRLSGAADIPTMDEAGLPEFYLSNWQAIFAPKGTPKEIVAKLNAAVIVALADSNVRVQLAELGQEIFPPDQQTPEALAAFQKAEIEKWWPIIKAANIKAQ